MKSILVSVIMVFLIADLGYSQQRGQRQMQERPQVQMQQRQHNPGMNIPNLTDEQREQIRKSVIENREKMLPLQNQLREKHARLRTLTTGNTVNIRDAEQVIDEVTVIQSRMMKNRINHRNEIRNILTDEQKVVFDTMGQRRVMQQRMRQNQRN
jgi:Spy/CpxP family protein refolding chaperone